MQPRLPRKTARADRSAISTRQSTRGHYCPKLSTLAVGSVAPPNAKYCDGETMYRISDVLPNVAVNLPVVAFVKAVAPVAWFKLSPLALLTSCVTVKLFNPATATVTTLLTLGSTGASDPPAYVPDREAVVNGEPDCGVINPKLTAESVPMMNA